MKKSLLITLLIFLIGSLPSYSFIDVVYPTTKETTINSDETFFTGSVDKNAKLKINSETVPLWQNSFFVHMVPLKYGKNIIKIQRTLDGQTEEQTYIVNRPMPQKNEIPVANKKNDYIPVEDGVLYAKTIKEDATVRTKPSTKGKRVLDIPSGVVLYLEGKKGEYYKINESGNSEYWIHETNLTKPIKVTQKILATVKKHAMYEDDLFVYHKFYTSHPVLYTFEQKDKSLKLVLHGIKDENSLNNYVYEFDLGHNLFGFEGYYQDNTFFVKMAKPPVVKDERFPLKGLKIFVDAGHGGTQKGCIGPDRFLEKDINLDIARKLIVILEEEEQANVTFSRFYDEDVALYNRVDMAKSDNAFISLSIHSNSLPYGKNPFKTHGTEVHYYNLNSQELAQIIQKNLANDLGLKNNGIHNSSFVLTRSTNPVSLLVEVAYMIHPNEYILLKDDEFRTNVAKSLNKSLKEYILFIKK